MPIIQNDNTMICDYCGAQGSLNVEQQKRLGTEWYAVAAAEGLGDPQPYTSLVFCRKCESHIAEIARIARYKAAQKINPPEPDDLLPEEDLPDTSFINSLPNPDIACIGSPMGYERLPVAIRVRKPSWTKKPALKISQNKSDKRQKP